LVLGIDDKYDNIDFLDYDVVFIEISNLQELEQKYKHVDNIYQVVIIDQASNISFDILQTKVNNIILTPFKDEILNNLLDKITNEINTQKELAILKQYKDIVDQTSIVSKANKKGIITFANNKFVDISGYSQEELIGKPHNIVRHKDMPKKAFKQMWDTIQSKKIWSGQVKNAKKDGSSYYVDATICPILNKKGQIHEYIALRNVITNIISPKKQLQDAISMSKKPILVFIKIDNYDKLEHIYGRGVVEQLEEELFNTFETYMPQSYKIDKKYNLTEGEFALLSELRDGEDTTQKELQLKQFQDNINHSDISIDECILNVSTIISFAVSKDHILENVKYGIKKAEREKLDLVYSDGLTESLKEESIKKTKTITMIQKALDENRVVSYFQPITNNKTKEIEKYESLVRILDLDGTVISPYFFLDIAKEARYYNKITSVVIDNSFEALNHTDKEISINLSALDIENVFIRNKLINMIVQNSHQAHRIVFELLEDEEVKDFNTVKDFISLVKTFGVQIAIDDFGAGVSNFERLLDYQPDILKIDACLIKNIAHDKYSKDVVDTIQLFAWKQDIKTVSEFVADENILKTVTDMGINYSQGFYLGKPMSFEEMKKQQTN
jgi:PAS domain S-box-containing protein